MMMPLLTFIYESIRDMERPDFWLQKHMLLNRTDTSFYNFFNDDSIRSSNLSKLNRIDHSPVFCRSCSRVVNAKNLQTLRLPHALWCVNSKKHCFLAETSI
jgi:hypothetical protein